MNRSGKSLGWLIPVGIAVALIAAFGKFPTLLTVGGILLGGVVALTAGALIIALKNSDKEAKEQEGLTNLSPEDAAVVSKARHDLTELRVLNARVREADVRTISNEVCNNMEKIINAIKADPARIGTAQMFLEYYMPTQKNILTKYQQIVESGLKHDELKTKVLAHLEDIKTATEKQLSNVFEYDMDSISAEMEMMNISIKEDGLV